MSTDISKLSISALQLLEQKQVLTPEVFYEKAEELLIELSKTEAADSFVIPKHPDIIEKMSFEIRTPMNSILGFTGLLKDSYFTLEEKDEFIDMIEKNTEQLIELLNDLTELTKIENLQVNLKMEKFELNVFLLNLITEFKSKPENQNFEIKKISDPAIPRDICIYTDPYQLKKILENLLNNFAKFESNGQIEMEVEILESHYLIIKIISNQLELPETISRSIKKHIGVDKDQYSFDGTGLKLTITRALIQLLNGEIHFNSHLPKGSEFTIKIPVKLGKLDQ